LSCPAATEGELVRKKEWYNPPLRLALTGVFARGWDARTETAPAGRTETVTVSSRHSTEQSARLLTQPRARTIGPRGAVGA